MAVLVIGADGQLGGQLLASWPPDGLTGTTFADLDITDGVATSRVLDDVAPDVVVNCAAWTDVDSCESNPRRAHRVNAVGAGHVAAAAERVGARLVHISTDYVHGDPPPVDAAGRPRPWRESDPAVACNEYGRSKRAGELLVRERASDHVIVRTSWLSGLHGDNFVRTMLRLGRAGEDVAVVDDQRASPTFAEDLAIALWEIVASDVSGVVNRANTGDCTWFDLAAATFAEAGVDLPLSRQSSLDLGRPARRPAWSVLDQSLAAAAGLSPLPHWRDGLRRLVRAADAVGHD